MRNNRDDEIENIVKELKALQLQQNTLIARLETLSEAEVNGPRVTSSGPTTIPPNTVRDFAIGDKVRVLNPRPLQASQGKIVKIGTNRISLKARGGSTIIRHPKNLALIEDE